MASNYNCHVPGSLSAHVVPNCPLPGMAHAPPALPLHDVVVKAEPRDEDVIAHGDVSSHDVIKANLAPIQKEVPSGRTVLGIKLDPRKRSSLKLYHQSASKRANIVKTHTNMFEYQSVQLKHGKTIFIIQTL